VLARCVCPVDTRWAMSATSVERIRQGFGLLRQAAATGDWEPFLETIHPEIEWFPHDLFPEQEVVHGRDGVRARFKLMWQDFEQIEFEPEEIIDAGDDTFIVRLYISARGKGSEVEVENRVYQVMRYRADMLVRLNWYSTREEALEVAGISEQDAHVES
jgi:ketosteroid isomerase-like protein